MIPAAPIPEKASKPRGIIPQEGIQETAAWATPSEAVEAGPPSHRPGGQTGSQEQDSAAFSFWTCPGMFTPSPPCHGALEAHCLVSQVPG